MHSIGMIQNQLSEVTQFMVSYEPMNPFSGWIRQILLCAMTWSILYCWSRSFQCTAVASMRRTEALASVKFYQILSIFIFFIRLIILEDFIRLISYNGPCVRLGCSFFLATALQWSTSSVLCLGSLLIYKYSSSYIYKLCTRWVVRNEVIFFVILFNY